MSHKAGKNFFKVKREWSKRKDNLLEKYLPNYLPKVAHAVKCPILIAEGFAGPGKFEDGSLGSPLIILNAVEKARLTDLPVAISACFIEKDPELFSRLEAEVASREGVRVLKGAFLDHLAHIADESSGKSLFLYLDPYTVEGLDWEALDRVFERLQRGSSVELLLNFNADSFTRRGLSALKMPLPKRDDDGEIDPIDPENPPTIAHLNDIVGGEWWKDILKSVDIDYPKKVAAIRDGVCAKLERRFKEVGYYDVKDHWTDKYPIYSMIFGSRSSVAIMLMNDAMASSREMEVEATKVEAMGGLFGDIRPTTLVPADEELRGLLLKVADRNFESRERLVHRVVKARMGAWTESRINHEVKEMCKARMLATETGKLVIGDKTGIRRR